MTSRGVPIPRPRKNSANKPINELEVSAIYASAPIKGGVTQGDKIKIDNAPIKAAPKY